MCNLYRMTKGRDEVARWFDVTDGAAGANFGAEVYPGYPGLVVAEGGLRQMTWGFPRAMTGAKGQALKPKPVNNARTDKLESFFWRDSFTRRRCLIPLTAWAEAEGARGAMTRTWLAMAGEELFAAAGLWRDSAEWGASYSMVMTESTGEVTAVHERMPVLLARKDWDRWTDGEPEEAFELCRPFEGAITIERTHESWAKRTSGSATGPLL